MTTNRECINPLHLFPHDIEQDQDILDGANIADQAPEPDEEDFRTRQPVHSRTQKVIHETPHRSRTKRTPRDKRGT